MSAQEQEDTDPRITIAQMNQAWSDIRGYTSTIWQIAALCLTVIALTLNVVYTSTLVEELLFLMLLFTSFFAVGGVFAIQSLRYNIAYRIGYIQEVEEKLTEIQEEYKVTPSLYLFGLGKFPLVFLFGVLLLTTEVLIAGFAIASVLLLISLSIETSTSILVTVIIFLSYFLIFNGYVFQKETDLRKKEQEFASDWKKNFRERLMGVIRKLKEESYEISYVYGFSWWERERERDFNIVVRMRDYEFIFITKKDYWESKEKMSLAGSTEKRIVLIVTPHHERLSEEGHLGAISISPISSSSDLRKYLLDGIAGKLIVFDDVYSGQ